MDVTNVYIQLDEKNRKLVQACPKRFLDDQYWYDVSEAYLDGELLYLKYRNMLVRHQSHPWLVRVK